MNDIDVQVIALIGRFVAALTAIALGALFVRWGANLYLAGVKGKSGSIKTVLKDAQFILSNGAPGTFLSAGGVIVMVTALMTMPEYDKGRVAGTRPKGMDTNPLQQQLRPEVLATTTIPAPDTLTELTSGIVPIQEAGTPVSDTRGREPRRTSTRQLASSPSRERVDTLSAGQPASPIIHAYVQSVLDAYSVVRPSPHPSAISWYLQSDTAPDVYALAAARVYAERTQAPWCPPSSMGQASAYSLQISPAWELKPSDPTRMDSLFRFLRETPPRAVVGGEP